MGNPVHDNHGFTYNKEDNRQVTLTSDGTLFYDLNPGSKFFLEIKPVAEDGTVLPAVISKSGHTAVATQCARTGTRHVRSR